MEDSLSASDLPPGVSHTSTTSQTSQATGPHRRTYQACIPCRKRKVRCDLGPVDDPHDPPCQRCRRESKECYFSATRRKRPWENDEEGVGVGEHDSPENGLSAYNVRKRSARGSDLHQDTDQLATGNGLRQHPFVSSPHRYPPDSPGDPVAQLSSAAERPNARGIGPKPEEGLDQEVTNATAAALFQTPINSPGDALHLLLQASGQSEVIQRSESSRPRKLERAIQRPSQASTPIASEVPRATRAPPPRSHPSVGPVDPAITGLGTSGTATPKDEDALSIWSRLRFVRAGWFTAKEAIAFIDYYYRYLAPMTPVSPPDIRQLSQNPNILGEEPMLVVTLLTIASRYMRLSGPGGQTRSYMIHERLWSCLQNMVTRMFWAQEQYGHGSLKGGGRRRQSKNADKAGLRSLGTIESLLLLSDFHPRSMHFPPAGDDEDIMAPSSEEAKEPAFDEGTATPAGGGSTLSDWTEPALRSDRMTWSLIGISHALAYELGIFGTYNDELKSVDGQIRRQGASSMHDQRADRIERLLYIYITQACGRFGFPIVYSDHFNKFNLSTLNQDAHIHHVCGFDHETPEDQIQGYWVEMAAINKASNELLFLTKSQTAVLIETGEYMTRLEQLKPIIREWRSKISSSKSGSHLIQILDQLLTLSVVGKWQKVALLIDLHYFRLYNNGLALQAVLEQWTTKLSEGRQADSPQTPASTLSAHFASLYSRNESYIKEVVDASHTILKFVVYDLTPNDLLKHATVRMYFRIVSAAMFLLKTFALGGKLNEVRNSLRLLQETIKALRTSVVDDVHLCLRIADLLEQLTSSIGNKFVRLPPQSLATNNNGTSPKRSKSTSSSQDFSLHPSVPPAPASSSQQQAALDSNLQSHGHDASTLFPSHLFDDNPDASHHNSGSSPMGTGMGGIPHTHTDPYNANIAIMPPPGGSYSTGLGFGLGTNKQQSHHPHHPSDKDALHTRDHSLDHRQRQQQQQQQPHHHQSQHPFSPSNPNLNPHDTTFPPNSPTASPNPTNPFPLFPSEEDWLTLDLQPLLTDHHNNNNQQNQDGTSPGFSGGGAFDTGFGGPGGGGGLGVGGGGWFSGAFGPETHNNLEVLGKLVDESWHQ